MNQIPEVQQDDKLHNFHVCGGEMGERTRSFDWSNTALGPIGSWPQSLKTLVRTLLDSRYAMWLGWGSDFTFFYNDAYARMTLGPKHPWALGRSAREVWSEIWREIGPRAESVVCTGQATWDEGLLLILERQGFPEETYHTFSYSPVPNDDGGIGGMLCVVTEDTQRTIGERRLRTLRELAARTTEEVKSVGDACQTTARTLAQNQHDLPFVLIYLLDDDAKKAKLVGVTGLPDGSPAAPPNIDLAMDLKESWPLRVVLESGHLQIVTGLGERFGPLRCAPWPEPTQRAVVVPMAKPGQPRPAGFLVAGISSRLEFSDEYKGFLELLASHVASAVSNARAYEEEKRRAEELAALDRAKTAFFSNVSHEFRTPLTLMLGPVEDLLARSHTDLTPAAAVQLELVNRNGLRLLRLVNSLLDFSRIEAGRVRALYQPTNLAAFTADLASNFRSACERAGLRLIVDCSPLKEPVFVDPDMWEKIVLNLVSNAFKNTFVGEIAVSLKKAGTAAELRVKDSGTGIPVEEMPRLFERFHRIENGRGRTHEGSGIGLALVQELVKLHGGSVTAESVMGKGTTFTVRVPLGSTHLPPEQIGEGRTTASIGTGSTPYIEEVLRWLPDDGRDRFRSELPTHHESLPMSHHRMQPDGKDDRPCVLVADDNADMRQYIVRLLIEQFQVEAVPDGEAALTAARDRPPDLILTDVMMPKLNGFALLKELRADPRTNTLPVIMLSARAGEESRVEGMEAGADDYLVKPFGARELLARVTAHIQMARLRREASESLRKSEERFRTLFESMDEGFCVIEMLYDAENRPIDYRFLEANPTFEKHTGVKDAVGRTIRELVPNHDSHWYEIYGQVASTGQATRFVNETKAIGRWFDVYAYRVGGPDSRKVGILFTDITARKRDEAALRESEERSAFVRRSSGVGFWYCDLPFDVLQWDDLVKAHFHLPHDAAVTIQTFYDRLHPDDREPTRQAIERSISSRTPFKMDYRTVNPDTGAVTWLRAIGRTFYAADGSPTRFDGVTLDVNDQKRAEERQAFLIRLADTLRPLSEPIDVQAEASRLLGEYLGANRVVYFEIRGDEYIIERDYTVGVRPLAGRYPVSSFGPDLLDSLLDGRTVIEADATTQPNRLPAERTTFAAIQVRGHVDVPLVKNGRFVAGMTVHVSDRRDWTWQEVAMIEDTAERTWAAVERSRVEVALRQSEERRRLALEAAELGAWQIDLVTNAFTTDERFRIIFGGTTEEMDYEQSVAAIHTDDQDRIRQAVSAATRPDDPAPYAEEFRVVHPDGSIHWIFAKGRANYDLLSPKRLISFDGTVADISARKRDEERNLKLLKELETQHAFVKAVISQAPAAIVVADADTGQILLSNEEAHRIVKHDYHKGKRLEDYGTTYIREAFATDGSRYVSGRWPLDRALCGETVVAEEIENVMFDQSRAFVSVNASPIRVGEKVVAAVVAFHDITDRKLAEQAARFLADASAALAELVNFEDTLQRVSQLAVTGFADWAIVDRTEATGSPRRIVVTHADPSKADLASAIHRRFTSVPSRGPANILRTGLAEIHSDITDEMLVAAAVDENDLRLLRKLGPKSSIGVPLKVQGETVGVLTFLLSESGRRYGEKDLAVANDLASRASIAIENSLLYARLKDADRRKDEFLATLAHELRNPLAPIRNGLQLLALSDGEGITGEKVRTMMERQLGQMVRLVDDLLDVSRINQGKLELRLERIDIAKVLTSAVEISRPLIEQMGHTLEIMQPDHPVVINADLTRLAQVLSNLLNNAAKYSEREGHITLTAELHAGDVVVAVRDTGIGIAADQLPHIFEMFSQVKSALERSQGGLGIGLSLVNRLVEMHGGSIKARSDGLGKGSEFVVRLPVAVDSSRPESQIEENEDDLKTSLRILVVDDNRDSADSLAQMLEFMGGDTRIAYDGEQAVTVAGEFQPDVIVLDIGLPKLNGYEACRRIRALPSSNGVMIIAQTGWGQDEDRQRTQEAGFDHHLVKPVDPTTLMKLLAMMPGAAKS